MRGLIAIFVMGSFAAPALSHGGGLDRNGCHNNRRTGDYHCHRDGPGIPVTPRFFRAPTPPVFRAPPVVAPRLVSPVSSDLVARIQAGLIRLGYDLETPDNSLGPKTQFAIMKFQEAEAIRIDGTASADLLKLIEAKIALGAATELRVP
jgi:Putative peptidoglycan binding domain